MRVPHTPVDYRTFSARGASCTFCPVTAQLVQLIRQLLRAGTTRVAASRWSMYRPIPTNPDSLEPHKNVPIQLSLPLSWAV